jgi:mono/diheme cytochrome c family protein
MLIAACAGSGEKPAPATSADSSHAEHAAAPAAPAPAPGADAYAVCQTCHQANGEGLPNAFPSLVGSEYVNGPGGPHIAIVLKGLTGPITVKGQTFTGVMAPWESLGDDQIAAAINYERASWGNSGAPVTQADVARIREAVKGRTAPWTVAELEKANLK